MEEYNRMEQINEEAVDDEDIILEGEEQSFDTS